MASSMIAVGCVNVGGAIMLSVVLEGNDVVTLDWDKGRRRRIVVTGLTMIVFGRRREMMRRAM